MHAGLARRVLHSVVAASVAPPLRRFAAPFAVASWLKEADKAGVEFVGSFTTPKDMPSMRLPEVTLAGRSNVGKSSALNLLSGRRKKVAVVSKTPGRTRLLNLFRAGKACSVTDLPGYGYAKVSEELQTGWRKSIEAYLKGREELRLAVLFVDAQREPQATEQNTISARARTAPTAATGPQETDAQLLDFLDEYELPSLVVATKADKLKPAALQASLQRLHESLALPDGQPLPLSSKTGAGRSELWQRMQSMCEEGRGR